MSVKVSATALSAANRCTSTWNGIPLAVVPAPVTTSRVVASAPSGCSSQSVTENWLVVPPTTTTPVPGGEGAGRSGAVTSVGGPVLPSDGAVIVVVATAGAPGREDEDREEHGQSDRPWRRRGYKPQAGGRSTVGPAHRRRRLASRSAATRTKRTSYWRRRMRPSPQRYARTHAHASA